MDEYMLRQEEDRLCKKYGAANIKEVLRIQDDILKQYYRLYPQKGNEYYR